MKYDLHARSPLTLLRDMKKLHNFAKKCTEQIFLDLSQNCLSAMDVAALVKMLAALPVNVVGLDLSENALGERPVAEVQQILAAIPAFVHNLDLSKNGFDDLKADLANAVSALPLSITHLDLSCNFLSNLDAQPFIQIFKLLPKSLIELRLAQNGLGVGLTGSDLAQAFTHLPLTLRRLDLQNNILFCMYKDGFAGALSAIKAPIIELDLSYNKLGSKVDVDVLLQIFNSIPKSVQILRLNYNYFARRTLQNMTPVFAAIPDNVVHLEFIDDEDPAQMNAKTLAQIFKPLAQRPIKIYCDKDLPIVRNQIFKTLPLYFYPNSKLVVHGAPFALSYFQQKLPLLFRPLKSYVQELPVDAVEKVYAFLNYKEICRLALAKIPAAAQNASAKSSSNNQPLVKRSKNR